MAVEVGRAVKPRAGSEEDAAYEPVGAIVAVGSAVIGWVIEVPIRTNRGRSDAYADRDLRGCQRSGTEKKYGGDGGNSERFKVEHRSSFDPRFWMLRRNWRLRWAKRNPTSGMKLPDVGHLIWWMDCC
jgi:hypothetical protein